MENATEFANLTFSNSSTLTQTELWIQLVVFYLLINGICSGSCNGLIFLAIVIERKKLSTRFFVIVAALALTRALGGFQIIIIGCYRILRTLGLASLEQTRFRCYMVHFLLYFGNTIEMALLIVLVVDRVMAISASDRYRQLTPFHAAKICTGISILIAFIKILMSLTMDNIPDSISCDNMYSPAGNTFTIYCQNIDFSLVVLLLLIYFCLIIDLRLKSRQTGTAEAKAALRRRLRVMPAIRNLVLLHCLFTLTSKLAGVLSTVSAFKEQENRIIAYQGMMICCDNFISGLALVISNTELRKAIKNLLTRQAKVEQLTLVQVDKNFAESTIKKKVFVSHV